MKLSILVVVLVTLLAKFQLPVISQHCLGVLRRGFSDPDDPPFNDDNSDGLPASPAVQAIIPTYKFYCDCVNITSWETYVQPGGRNHQYGVFDITFQVWRPSPTVNSSNGYEGCYSLVGENVFTSVTVSEGSFVQLSPTPPSIITAQSGDVVGYYTNSRGGNDEGIQLERDNDYNENIVLYKMEMDSLRTNNKLSVGPGGALTVSTRAAPMLKVSTSEVRCPTEVSSTSSINVYSSTISILFEASSSNNYYSSLANQGLSSSEDELVMEYTSTFTDDKTFVSSVVRSFSSVVKPSDAYYEYSAIMDFQNTTISSYNNEVHENRTLIFAILVPGFIVLVVLVIFSMLCLILVRIKRITIPSKDVMSNSSHTKCTISMEPNEAYESVKEASKVDSLDFTLIVKANSAYGSHSFGNPHAEITPVCCIAYDSMENWKEGSHNNENEKLTATNDEAEYSHITN